MSEVTAECRPNQRGGAQQASVEDPRQLRPPGPEGAQHGVRAELLNQSLRGSKAVPLFHERRLLRQITGTRTKLSSTRPRWQHCLPFSS